MSVHLPKYFTLHRGTKDPVELDRLSAIIQLEGGGSLNGAWELDQATQERPATTKYASFWKVSE